MHPCIMTTGPMLSIAPICGSYPFQTKYIPLSSTTKHVLGSVEGGGKVTRVATPANGWFASKNASEAPLTLSSMHAEIWMEEGKIYLRDLDSAFGTYVNGAKVKSTVTLNTGDTLDLGTKIDRNSRTPGNITDLQLLNIAAKVTIVGITS